MPNPYKVVNGKTCEVELLDLGAQLTRGGPLDLQGARLLWENALDGNKVTEREKNSILHIMTKGLTDAAREFLEHWLNEKTASKLIGSQTERVDGVSCDRSMLRVAEHFQKRAGPGRPLCVRGAEGVWFSALDGRGVTRREKDTLAVILRKYDFDEPGRAFLESKLSWMGVAADAEAVASGGAPLRPDAIILPRRDALALEYLPPPPAAPREAPPPSRPVLPSCPSPMPETLPAAPGGRNVRLPGLQAAALNDGEATLLALADGRHVRLHGLQTAALNDVEATCEKWDDAKQRWLVRLAGGEVKALKPENLQIVSAPCAKRPLDERARATHDVASAALPPPNGSEPLRHGLQAAASNLVQGLRGMLPVGSAAAGGAAAGEKAATEEQSAAEEPPAKRHRAAPAPKVSLAKLRDIFDKCDTDNDGQINKREFIKACRANGEIARFFEVPSVIRQEDGSRSKVEEVFQSLDADGDRAIRWAELLAFYRDRMAEF